MPVRLAGFKNFRTAESINMKKIFNIICRRIKILITRTFGRQITASAHEALFECLWAPTT
jgi:hypothetical protein